MRSPKREREREGRGAVRRNVAISLRDRTKHSPSAIAEIEACTCPVRKGRAPLSLLRLSTLARSLAPSRSPVSLALLVSSSLYPSAAPVRPRNSHALFLSLCPVLYRPEIRSFVVSSLVLHFIALLLLPLLHLLRALSSSSSLDRVLRHLPLLFSPRTSRCTFLTSLRCSVFSSAGRAVWLCVYTITLFSSTGPANAVSRFTHASCTQQ